MFQLKEAVDDWCHSVHANHCRKQLKIDELKDHLYCEIEVHQEAGLDEEAAFNAAIDRLGNAGDLAAEHSRNLSLLGRIHELEMKHQKPPMSPLKSAGWLIGLSLFFAALMIATRYLIDDAETADQVVLWMTAIWWVPFTYLIARQAGANSAAKEWRCIKRRLGFGK